MDPISLENLLLKIAEEHNIVSPKIVFADSPTHGYFSNVHRITLKDSETDDELHLFSKEKPKEIQDGFNYFYKNEAEFYNKVVQEFQGLLTVKEPSLPLIPKCYYASNDFIILEDLLESGCKVWNPLNTPLDAIHIKTVLESYAKFHAFSFALKNKNLGKFNSIGDRFDWFLSNHEKMINNGFYQSVAEKLANCFDEDTEIHYIEAITKFCTLDQLDYLQKLDNCRDNEVYNHGDNWTYNYMFHYQNDNWPMKAYILDFQIFRRTTPVLDLSSFLTICACSDDISEKMLDYLKFYHKSLVKHLTSLDCPTNIYTWETLMDEWQKYSLKGLMVAALLGKMMIASKEELEVRRNIELPDKLDFISCNETIYRKRMRLVIKYFYDTGILAG